MTIHVNEREGSIVRQGRHTELRHQDASPDALGGYYLYYDGDQGEPLVFTDQRYAQFKHDMFDVAAEMAAYRDTCKELAQQYFDTFDLVQAARYKAMAHAMNYAIARLNAVQGMVKH